MIIRNKRQILYILIYLSIACAGNAQEVHIEDSLSVSTKTVGIGKDLSLSNKKSPQRAMLYSVLFPGMGQLYNGKKFKSFVFFCTEAGLLANSIYLNQMYVNSTYEADRDFYLNNRNLSTWYLVGAVLISALDAFVDAHLADFDESPELGLKRIPGREQPALYLSMSVHF